MPLETFDNLLSPVSIHWLIISINLPLNVALVIHVQSAYQLVSQADFKLMKSNVIAVLVGDGMKKPKRAIILTNAKKIISVIHPLSVKTMTAVSLVNGEFILLLHSPRLSIISVITRIVHAVKDLARIFL